MSPDIDLFMGKFVEVLGIQPLPPLAFAVGFRESEIIGNPSLWAFLISRSAGGVKVVTGM
jgi:hypothetical protein